MNTTIRDAGDAPAPDAARPILVVEDEEDIRDLLVEVLEREGHRVVTADGGRSGLRVFHELRPRLVLLDVMMPDLDGWAVLERIRDISDVPVIMLTARSLEWERARGLRAGADDYVTKPFSPMELAARVGAVLRRSGGEEQPATEYDDGYVRIAFAQRRVSVEGRVVSLTPLEFRLLTAFVRNRGIVLDRDRLMELVWGSRSAVMPDQVKLYVGYLRRKLEDGSGEPSPIETVRGFGYMYAR